jgi:hypothetical protein
MLPSKPFTVNTVRETLWPLPSVPAQNSAGSSEPSSGTSSGEQRTPATPTVDTAVTNSDMLRLNTASACASLWSENRSDSCRYAAVRTYAACAERLSPRAAMRSPSAFTFMARPSQALSHADTVAFSVVLPGATAAARVRAVTISSVTSTPPCRAVARKSSASNSMADRATRV